MALFKCRACGAVENTALTMCSWTRMYDPLCSQCCPEQKNWHGLFVRTTVMPKGEEDRFKHTYESKKRTEQTET